MSKNDVWRELEERLKQKAFEKYDGWKWHKAVWLEDVKKELQQLKQNYVLIERKKLEDFRCFIRKRAEGYLHEMKTKKGIAWACLEARLGAYDEITLKLMELLKE